MNEANTFLQPQPVLPEKPAKEVVTPVIFPVQQPKKSGWKLYNILVIILLLITLILLGFVAYRYISDYKYNSKQQTSLQPLKSISLSQAKLPLLDDYNYELWLKTETSYVSLGKFNVNLEGEIVDLEEQSKSTFEVVNPQLEAKEIAISLEKKNDDSQEISGLLIAEAEVSSGSTGNLIFQAAKYSQMKGGFVVEDSGIWFGESLEEAYAPTLELPELPLGWKYAAWYLHEETPLFLGKFANGETGDDLKNFYESQENEEVPGEKFTTNLPENIDGPIATTDITGEAIISIEPDLLQAGAAPQAPFFLQPLTKLIGNDLKPGIYYNLDLNTKNLPDVQFTLNYEQVLGLTTSSRLKLQVDKTNLPILSAGFYELWHDNGTNQSSVEVFNVNTEGKLINTRGEIIDEFVISEITNLSQIFVTAENTLEEDNVASDVQILTGILMSSEEQISLSFPSLFRPPAAAMLNLAEPATSNLSLLAPNSGWTYSIYELKDGQYRHLTSFHKLYDLENLKFDDVSANSEIIISLDPLLHDYYSTSTIIPFYAFLKSAGKVDSETVEMQALPANNPFMNLRLIVL